MHLFYTPEDVKETGHCVKVLRLKEKDTIFLTNGKGTLHKAEISRAHPKKCMVEITETRYNYGKKDFFLHIGIAPPKSADRFGFFLEKCTEIGIDKITPMLCFHAERKQINTQRMNRVITAAMKQSFKAFHPELNKMAAWKEILKIDFPGQKFIAHCKNTEKSSLINCYKPLKNAFILIGPEGDFSDKEIQEAVMNGFIEITLGNSRMRTETAGVAACHIINLLNSNQL